jgi:hypothetical protein
MEKGVIKILGIQILPEFLLQIPSHPNFGSEETRTYWLEDFPPLNAKVVSRTKAEILPTEHK